MKLFKGSLISAKLAVKLKNIVRTDHRSPQNNDKAFFIFNHICQYAKKAYQIKNKKE